jgi:hypothetical protein
VMVSFINGRLLLLESSITITHKIISQHLFYVNLRTGISSQVSKAFFSMDILTHINSDVCAIMPLFSLSNMYDTRKIELIVTDSPVGRTAMCLYLVSPGEENRGVLRVTGLHTYLLSYL